jgi:hypothetical protein
MYRWADVGSRSDYLKIARQVDRKQQIARCQLPKKGEGSGISKPIPCVQSTKEAHDGSEDGHADGQGVERAHSS